MKQLYRNIAPRQSEFSKNSENSDIRVKFCETVQFLSYQGMIWAMNRGIYYAAGLGLLVYLAFGALDNKIEYTDQFKVTQGLLLAKPYRTAVESYWQEHQDLPNAEAWTAANVSVKADISKSLVEKVEVGVKSPGVVSVYYNPARIAETSPELNGVVHLEPMATDTGLQWRCLSELNKEFLPKACK